MLGAALVATFAAVDTAAADPGSAGLPSSAGGYARLAPETGGATEHPKVFTSPRRGFALPVPPGAEVVAREDGDQIAVQSRRGYALNLQVADANPEVPLKAMIGRLDRRYLGDGRPWAAKLSQRELQVQGLPAIEATYAGGSTKVRATIVRGDRTDFVFLFFAPALTFDRFAGEFSWILENFQPASVELAGAEAAPSATPVAPAGPEEPPTASVPAVQRFAEPGFGYAIEYPSEWVAETTKAFTTQFSGRKGTPAYDAIVSVQNVRAGVTGQPGEGGAAAVVRSLKDQLGAGTAAFRIVGEEPVVYDRDGLRLEGQQFVAAYEHAGRSFRKWTLVLPRPSGDIAHVWSFTAPAAAFDTFRPVAEGMLRSWVIEGRAG